ncbi:MAG TPA: BON domain-containing protein [Thermoanaerobaculia bacterium]
MHKKTTAIWLLLVVALMASACSMNRQMPAELDGPALEADVRAAIATAVPGKTFSLSVDTTSDGHVKLSGHVDSASDRDAIVSRVRQVNGVRSVDATQLHVQ